MSPSFTLRPHAPLGLEGLGQHALGDGLVADEARHDEGDGQEQLEHGRLPLHERLVVERDGEPAEDDHQARRHERHRLDAPLLHALVDDHRDGHRHRHAGRDVDVAELQRDERR
ncbi:MAG: hypothetical protein U1F43_19345 [Myxococcota bacterium]